MGTFSGNSRKISKRKNNKINKRVFSRHLPGRTVKFNFAPNKSSKFWMNGKPTMLMIHKPFQQKHPLQVLAQVQACQSPLVHWLVSLLRLKEQAL